MVYGCLARINDQLSTLKKGLSTGKGEVINSYLCMWKDKDDVKSRATMWLKQEFPFLLIISVLC